MRFLSGSRIKKKKTMHQGKLISFLLVHPSDYLMDRSWLYRSRLFYQNIEFSKSALTLNFSVKGKALQMHNFRDEVCISFLVGFGHIQFSWRSSVYLYRGWGAQKLGCPEKVNIFLLKIAFSNLKKKSKKNRKKINFFLHFCFFMLSPNTPRGRPPSQN